MWRGVGSGSRSVPGCLGLARASRWEAWASGSASGVGVQDGSGVLVGVGVLVGIGVDVAGGVGVGMGVLVGVGVTVGVGVGGGVGVGSTVGGAAVGQLTSPGAGSMRLIWVSITSRSPPKKPVSHS